MKKSDLVAGKHFVEFEDGIIGLVVEDGYVVLNSDDFTWGDFDNFAENLTHTKNNIYNALRVGVSNNKIGKIVNRKSFFDIEWIWEREEAKEMTVAEIEKELGYSVKVVK